MLFRRGCVRALVAALAAGAITHADSATAGYAYPWQNPSLPTSVRVSNLISLLTLEEKVANLVHNASAVPRLAFPAYEWAHEAERGDVSAALGTGYPTPLALGGTFDPTLIYAIAQNTSIEVRGNSNEAFRAGGIRALSVFAPVVNLVRNPLWGRTQEMLCGEDPFLGRVLSRAWVSGMQSDILNSSYRILNTVVKHYDVYGGPEGYGTTFGPNALRFGFNAVITERMYRETFLPNFVGAAEAGVGGFMCSYSSVTFLDNPSKSNATPACGNHYLLTEILRNELNLTQSYVLSDAGAVVFQYTYHHSVPDGMSAAIASLTAGMDIELTCCGAASVFPTLVAAVQQGLLNESALDTALARTLPYRFEIGLLDPPGSTPYDTLNASNVYTPQMQQLALDAALAAVVLLKNSNNALPVTVDSLVGKRVCLFGPNANDTLNQMGEYAPKPAKIVTPYAAFASLLPASTVILADGCNTTACVDFDPTVVQVAATCDLNVVVLGLTAYARSQYKNESAACGCDKGDAVEGECCDRYDANLPGLQLQLLQAIAGVGKPTVLVTVNAGMLNLTWAQTHIPAIVNGIYLGQHSGTAIAMTILGLHNPSGRLTTTWYNNISDIGDIGDYMAPSTYRYFAGGVLYPFGHGLSYTSFEYALVGSVPASISPCSGLNITFTITNTGNVDGHEPAQLYLSTANASVPLPIKSLINFQKVFVPRDVAVSLTLTIAPADLAIMRDGDFLQIVEPGVRSFWLGTSSDNASGVGIAGTFTVSDPVTPLSQCGSNSTRVYGSGASFWKPAQ